MKKLIWERDGDAIFSNSAQVLFAVEHQTNGDHDGQYYWETLFSNEIINSGFCKTEKQAQRAAVSAWRKFAKKVAKANEFEE